MEDREKIKRAIDGVKTCLLQKNARCPNCAGTLKFGYNSSLDNMSYRCINCQTEYIPREDGFTESEFICDIISRTKG